MNINPGKASSKAGFTLFETVLSIAIMAMVYSATLVAYIHASMRAEWSGYSLAAQALAVRQSEVVRAAIWDTQSYPVVDNTTNVLSPVACILDLPLSATNAIWATNTVTVSTLSVSVNPPVSVKIITVNTVWPWNGAYFTNTMVTYRSPDQ